MDKIAALNRGDRRDLFREVAVRRGNLNGPIVEKDFWVCWTLRHLFSCQDLPASMIFKGGTSLSKVFHAIERFSEDVDLSLSREDLGFVGQRDPSDVKTGKQANRLIKELDESCRQAIHDHLLPALESKFSDILGPPGTEWSLEIDSTDTKTINFFYPRGIELEQLAKYSYVKPVVRLEMGARSDHWPAGNYEIRPYAADQFPEQFESFNIPVRALAAERTFWDKIVVLHAEHHRPADKPRLVDRLSRHYYDVARLYQDSIGAQALTQLELLQHVVDHQLIFFPRKWAKYEEAVPGSLRILPSQQRAQELGRDYRAMRDYFFGEVPEFPDVLATIQELENQVNSAVA